MSIRKERAAYESAVLPHLNALYGSAFRLTRNAGDAEDLVQDALLRAYRFWGSFHEGSNCKAWLFKILTNTFINSYQKKRRNKEILNAAITEQETTDGTLIQTTALNHRSPVDVLLENSMSEDVERALASIPGDFRVAVVLCDVEGFSYKEIAEILECPVGTVMSRLYRGRRLLQSELREFAKKQGILKEEPADKPIDINQYRKTQSTTQK